MDAGACNAADPQFHAAGDNGQHLPREMHDSFIRIFHQWKVSVHNPDIFS